MKTRWSEPADTVFGRDRVSEAWAFSTRPITPQGKARVAANGRLRQKSDRSIRELRAEVADVGVLVDGIAELCESLKNVRGVCR